MDSVTTLHFSLSYPNIYILLDQSSISSRTVTPKPGCVKSSVIITGSGVEVTTGFSDLISFSLSLLMIGSFKSEIDSSSSLTCS